MSDHLLGSKYMTPYLEIVDARQDISGEISQTNQFQQNGTVYIHIFNRLLIKSSIHRQNVWCITVDLIFYFIYLF